MKNHNNVNLELQWRECFSSGLAALDAHNLKRAIKKLNEAVEIAAKSEFVEPLVQSLIALSDAQRFSGQLKQAETSLKRAVDATQDFKNENPLLYAFCLGGLGQIYMAQLRLTEAVTALETTVKILRQNRGSADPEFLPMFIALISCYLDQQEFEMADKLGRYTFDLCVALVGPTDMTTLTVMNMLAAAARESGKHGRAATLLSQIKSIRKDKKQLTDHLGAGPLALAAMDEMMNVETKEIVFDFGDGHEFTLNLDAPHEKQIRTKKTKSTQKKKEITQPISVALESSVLEPPHHRAISKDASVIMRIALRGSDPAIWRRIEIPVSTTLPQLHRIFQIVMGWKDCHLHSFYIGTTEYGDADAENQSGTIDERNIQLHQLLTESTPGFWYTYDFGDNWVHDIQIERVIKVESSNRYPKCIAGSQQCPPEDCGGIPGYYHLLSKHNESCSTGAQLIDEFMPHGFSPDEFDLDDLNKRLRYLAGVQLSRS